MVTFGIGQPLKRKEDLRLLTGRGRFIADLDRAGEAHAWFVRSAHAHGTVRAIDTRAARAAPGVLAVYTAADIAGALGPLAVTARPKGRDGVAARAPNVLMLTDGRVRYVGDTVAMVVAECAEAASAAAELVTVDIAPLPVVTDAAAALAPGAPQLWDEVPGNLCLDWEAGDAGAVEAGFANAARIVALEAANNRVVIAAMETRGALGWVDPDSDRYVLHTASQMPHPLRRELAAIFGEPEARFHVLVEDVGGGFGIKNSVYREHALVLWAARRLGRPVKWIGERTDAFLTDYHGRDRVTRAELALDADGHFLAIRIEVVANLGAHLAARGALPPTANTPALSGVYRTPALYARVRAVFTNTAPTEVYRGAGRPELLHLLERLVDVAAFDTGIDRIELRRRNTLRPEELPFATPLGLTYDAGRYAETLDLGLARADHAGFAARRAESQRRGLLRGFGLANFVERCGHGVDDSAELRIEADGTATVLTGTMSNGQGHETAFAQIAGDFLGIEPARVRVVQGDTDLVREGKGTGGSRSISLGGACLTVAAAALIAKAKPLAGHLLEAASADIEFADGRFRIAGTDRALDWAALAAAAADGGYPDDLDAKLDAIGRFSPQNHTYPNGCHCCEVEVDPETGAVRILRYTVVHDFGRVLNPLLLAGQVHGGVAQGLGQAVFEHVAYDPESGQLLTGSFMDYCVPRADQLPAIDLETVATPSPSNPAGFKGCGEAGAAGAPPAVVNAVVDALAAYGVRHLDMPLTPERVWRAIRAARQ
ncbi:MAG TPA: xanthine dehydrogenase family protein molybdopterin-binding subunit [Alphaproteobacteria bacterium]